MLRKREESRVSLPKEGSPRPVVVKSKTASTYDSFDLNPIYTTFHPRGKKLGRG